MHELSKLTGHRNDIHLMQFSRCGTRLATGARDGTIKLWRQAARKAATSAAGAAGIGGVHWVELHSFFCPPDIDEIQRAKLRRRPLQQPSINQVLWTCDDTQTVAAVSDGTIRVWNASSGTLVHILRAHTAQAQVLECHPTDRRLAVTAGYDGLVVLWDIESGRCLKRMSTVYTFPTVPGTPAAARGRYVAPACCDWGAVNWVACYAYIYGVTLHFVVPGCSKCTCKKHAKVQVHILPAHPSLHTNAAVQPIHSTQIL